MLLADIKEVIKASPAIQIQNRITHLQRRAWNVLLANAYNELPDKELHTVSVAELATKLGFDSHNYDHLKGTLKSLVDCTVEWNILGKNNKEVWGAASLLAEVKIEDGLCFYQFSHTLRQKLHNPLMYTKLNLRLQNRFKRQYALILWEVCFDYFDVHWGRGETPFIPLEKFRELIGVESDEYRTFKALNQKIIKPSIIEINNLTDYFVEVEQKRFKRKVAELKFSIVKVKKLPVKESVFPDVEDLQPVAVELVGADVDRKLAIKIADTEWDFIDPGKLPEPGTYPDFLAYVSEKVEMSMYASNVHNTAGYIIDAIRNNYQNENVRKERQIRAKRAREKELEDLTTEFYFKRDNLLRQAIQSDSELVERAADRIELPLLRKRLLEYDSAMRAYKEIPMVKAEIDAILADDFCRELLAPIVSAYEEEKGRILGDIV